MVNYNYSFVTENEINHQRQVMNTDYINRSADPDIFKIPEIMLFTFKKCIKSKQIYN